MDFQLIACRLEFRVVRKVYFPIGKAANVLRGALGNTLRSLVCGDGCIDSKTCPRSAQCPYAYLFEPAARGHGPSGLVDWPRPFVLRCHDLDGKRFASGSRFEFDVHVFDIDTPALAWLIVTFAQVGRDGIGPGEGVAVLDRVWSLDSQGDKQMILWDRGRISQDPPDPIRLSLEQYQKAVSRVVVRFLTPTELKSDGEVASAPAFEILFARIRDRISTLRDLYGPGPLQIEFSKMKERASRVAIAKSNIRHERRERLSSRTEMAHPLGGFIGDVEYAGDLAEFVPYLHAAYWTGVGRHTVWGKGVMEILRISA